MRHTVILFWLCVVAVTGSPVLAQPMIEAQASADRPLITVQPSELQTGGRSEMHPHAERMRRGVPSAPLLLICCAIIPGLFLLALWLWALIDCLQRDFNDNDKIIWVLVIVLLNWIGAILYFLIGRSQGRSRDRSPSPPTSPPTA